MSIVAAKACERCQVIDGCPIIVNDEIALCYGCWGHSTNIILCRACNNGYSYNDCNKPTLFYDIKRGMVLCKNHWSMDCITLIVGRVVKALKPWDTEKEFNLLNLHNHYIHPDAGDHAEVIANCGMVNCGNYYVGQDMLYPRIFHMNNESYCYDHHECFPPYDNYFPYHTSGFFTSNQDIYDSSIKCQDQAELYRDRSIDMNTAHLMTTLRIIHHLGGHLKYYRGTYYYNCDIAGLYVKMCMFLIYTKRIKIPKPLVLIIFRHIIS